MKNVILYKKEHRGEPRIFIKSDFDFLIIAKIKNIKGRLYSNTNKCWHIPYSKASWNIFLSLNIPYTLQSETEKEEYKKETNQQINKSILIGSAPHSPMHSDTTDIESDQKDSQSMAPSDGDSKDVDIHLSKGGREVTYSGGKFVIKLFYNESDVAFLKKLRGYWISKDKVWIVKGDVPNLEALQGRFKFWDEAIYQQVEELILVSTNPYVVTLYNMPDNPKVVAVAISGYLANPVIMQKATFRAYQKDNKRWILPNESVIIDRLIESYTQDGATIINRLPQDCTDYEKKRPSYGDWTKHWLAKTDTDLKPLISVYLDDLCARRYSLRTFDKYLGSFIKFVKHVGKDRVNSITIREVHQYLSFIGDKKVSNSYLHGAVNSIKYYYKNVVKNPSIEIDQIYRPKKVDTLPKILSTQEIDRILRSTKNLKHTTLLYTLYSSGIRLNEILHLRVEDLWWDRDQIMVRKGKGNKDRVVPFSGVLKELLILYFEEYKPIYWVFEGQDRTHQYSDRSVQNVVKKAAKTAKVNKVVTPHTIRHCFATHLMDDGTEVRYIQELLGHADIKTTLIYTHVTNHSLSKIKSPLDRLMQGKENFNFSDKNDKKPES